MSAPPIEPRRFRFPSPDTEAAARCRARHDTLTKPTGSLGRLEQLAIELAALQGETVPASRPAAAILFASDHPVAARGVSAYPPAVTRAMVANFAAGGAAASVLSRQLGLPLHVVDVGVAGGPVLPEGPGAGPGASYHRAAAADMPVGDLLDSDAMAPATYAAAIEAGAAAIDALGDDVRVVLLGEMGIGNTTPAAAVCAALLGAPAEVMVGPGTGVAGAALRRKIEVVEGALARARAAGVDLGRGAEAVRAVGGRDIAALVGAMARAVERRIAVLVDGFIVSAAALALCADHPEARVGLLFAHRSREPGHRLVLERLGARPLLELEMALGEASGALVALPIVDAACAIVRDMATFASAGVPDKSTP
jgi:nicotinate-nucleotide--dimethylbenzimidazole phosphoribosyltransferase